LAPRICLLNSQSTKSFRKSADHIFDSAAIASMCAVQFTDRSEQALCLLETETTGMVGLFSSCLKMNRPKEAQRSITLEEN